MGEKAKRKVTWAVRGLYDGDPEKVAREIEGIGESVKPQDIVDYARKHPESQLYKCFTWDDGEAAEKWRRHEATSIVCNIRYAEASDSDEGKAKPTMLRVFYMSNSSEGYVPTKTIIRNESGYESLLAMCRKDIDIFKRKYKTLAEAADIIKAMEEF